LIFDFLKYWVFSIEIVEAQIVLGDQAVGLKAVMPIIIPNAKF